MIVTIYVILLISYAIPDGPLPIYDKIDRPYLAAMLKKQLQGVLDRELKFGAKASLLVYRQANSVFVVWTKP